MRRETPVKLRRGLSFVNTAGAPGVERNGMLANPVNIPNCGCIEQGPLLGRKQRRLAFIPVQASAAQGIADTPAVSMRKRSPHPLAGMTERHQEAPIRPGPRARIPIWVPPPRTTL